MEADINVLTYEVNGHPEIYCAGDVRPMGFSKSGNTANTDRSTNVMRGYSSSMRAAHR